jgi:hypothetical protein
MGMDLRGCQRDLSVSQPLLAHTYDLAVQFGWRPQGTDWNVHVERASLERAGVSPHQIDAELASAAAARSGLYLSNDYQIVTAADAVCWAAALQRALPHIPENNHFVQKMMWKWFPERGWVWSERSAHEFTPLEYLAGRKNLIWQFIQLCRDGEFEIW